MTKLVGKVKTFSINTRRICEQCGKIVKRESTGTIRCPDCGVLHWPQFRRIWFAITYLDVFDTSIRAFFLDKNVSRLLSRFRVSWQMSMDKLKGLRGIAWLETYKDIKREIELEAKKRLIGQVIVVHGKLSNSKTLFVKKIGKATKPKISGERKRFVEGKLEELFAITQKVLLGYDKGVELWEDIPIINFTKELQEEKIEIGLRAPLTEYGKSYRVWMKVNDVLMYPAKPVRTGKNRFSWVLRVYHTKGWKNRLEKILSHCVDLEEQAVRIVEAARKIDVQQAEKILHAELLIEEKEDVLEMWQGGSLWELVEIVSKVNRAAGIRILKKLGLLRE
ncbi:MAG: hypothetical protein ACFFCW_49700 [Candidatus Hodarchaeota archaeon]